MTEHTPGPWTLQAGRTIRTVSGEFYLSYGQDKHGNPLFRGFCELDANARLIAAAPETAAERDRLKAEKAGLVEVLEDLTLWGEEYLASCKREGSRPLINAARVKRARAAIIKARR